VEDKRETNRSLSPSKEGSSSPSSASTPLSALSRSSSPPGSPLEVSSRRHCSSIFEQGGPFEKIPVVDLSSLDEENLIPNTSRDAEFARRLFGDLNNRLLQPLDDGKIIILSDSNEEEEEVHEEDVVTTEAAPSSAVKSPAPTTSATDADNADNGHSLDRAIGDSSSSGNEASLP
jgi:hypothetical protein